MRSLYSKDIIDNPYRTSPFQQRSRLKSLKELRQIPFQQSDLKNKHAQQQILQLLERKLIEENYKQENEEVHAIVDPKKNSMFMPSKHSVKEESENKLITLRQSNKLFHYFEELFKKEIPSDKVERQKVNFCQKQFDEIKTKVYSKLQLNKTKLNQLQQTLKQKYLELHEYHEKAKQLTQQIKQQRKLKQSLEQQKKQRQQRQTKPQLKANTSTITLRPPSLKQKLYIMEQTINHLKLQISKIQEEIQSTYNKEVSIKEEWVMFLKLFLNTGYYLIDGCEKILREFKKIDVKLERDDLMTQFIDDNAKRFLLTYYRNFQIDPINSPRKDNLTEFSGAYNTLSKDEQQNRQRIRSTIEMKTLAKESNLKNIYSNTKSAMMNLLKNSLFRAPSQTKPQKDSFLPKIQPRKHSVTNNQSRVTTLHDHQAKDRHQLLTNDELKRQEINRINHIYYGNGAGMEEKGKLLKRILFGFNAK